MTCYEPDFPSTASPAAPTLVYSIDKTQPSNQCEEEWEQNVFGLVILIGEPYHSL